MTPDYTGYCLEYFYFFVVIIFLVAFKKFVFGFLVVCLFLFCLFVVSRHLSDTLLYYFMNFGTVNSYLFRPTQLT